MDCSDEQVRADRLAVEHGGTALADLARSHPRLAVPTCPGWDIGRLLVHTGGAHRWATANLEGGGRVRLSQLPAPPDEIATSLDWYREGLDALLAVAASVDPLAPVWTFAASGERRGAWWLRRMAQETAVHHWDAAASVATAGGPPPEPLDAELAAAGIEEYLLDFLPRLPVAGAGWTGTLHLHATDATSEWLVDLGDAAVPALPVHAKADTALRGPASELLLWLWNRSSGEKGGPGGIEVHGDRSLLARWRTITI